MADYDIGLDSTTTSVIATEYITDMNYCDMAVEKESSSSSIPDIREEPLMPRREP